MVGHFATEEHPHSLPILQRPVRETLPKPNYDLMNTRRTRKCTIDPKLREFVDFCGLNLVEPEPLCVTTIPESGIV